MSAATSSRSSATWSRSPSAWCATKMREDVKARAHVNAEERVLEALVGKTASPATRDSFRKKLRDGELDDKEIELEVADTGTGGMPGFEIPGMPGANIGVLNINDMLSKAMGGKRTKTRQDDRHGLLRAADRRRIRQAPRPGRGGAGRRFRADRERRHRLPRRDRQDRRARRRRRRRRLPRGRAARPAAAGRRHDGGDQVRPGEDRPHPVHRLRRLPCRQAVGPAARAAGPPADPRRAPGAREGRFPPHPDRDRGEPDQAVHRADADRRA